jgi:cobalt-zinc-cadmium efflux system protein
MAHGHTHADGHAHSHADGANTATRRLVMTLGLVVAYMGVEVVGGLISGSLALIADAGHMLSDAGALGLTLFAMRFARRPSTAQRTYGSYRAEILAALVNGATLVAVAIYIFVEAFERFRTPPVVAGGVMALIAGGGLVVNIGGLLLLGREHGENLNMRGAWLHVLSDALGSLQAIVAGLLIWAYGWWWVDPIASVLIGLLVVYSSWALIQQSVAVLMEGAPGHINVDDVRRALRDLPAVTGVHDLHVWTITSGFVALSAHVTCASEPDHAALLRQAQTMLAEQFGIRHSTIQIDLDEACAGAPDPLAQKQVGSGPIKS